MFPLYKSFFLYPSLITILVIFFLCVLVGWPIVISQYWSPLFPSPLELFHKNLRVVVKFLIIMCGEKRPKLYSNELIFPLHVTPSLSFKYSCFRKSNISLTFFPIKGISLAVASLKFVPSMALKTGEWMLSICRWTWNFSSSTTSTKSLFSQGSEKGCVFSTVLSFASWLQPGETKPVLQNSGNKTSYIDFGVTP